MLRATGNVSIGGTITVNPGAQDMGPSQPHPASRSAPRASRWAASASASSRVATDARRNLGGGAGARPVTAALGGEGGGSLEIVALGNVVVSGTINANGRNGVNPQTGSIMGTGGGGGGVVVIIGKSSLQVSGTISVTGGNGSNGWSSLATVIEGGGGGGGGGIVHLLSSTTPVTTGTIAVSGGTNGSNFGTSGSVYAGGGGGACGGNGGSAGSTNTTPGPGQSGFLLTTTSPTPENLAL